MGWGLEVWRKSESPSADPAKRYIENNVQKERAKLIQVGGTLVFDLENRLDHASRAVCQARMIYVNRCLEATCLEATGGDPGRSKWVEGREVRNASEQK